MAKLARRNTSTDQTKAQKKTRVSADKFDLAAVSSRILESPKNYNDILIVLGRLADSEDSDEYFNVCAALLKIFGTLAKREVLTKRKSSSKGKAAVGNWLMERYEEFWRVLLDQIESNGPENSTALVTLLKLLSMESKYFSSGEYFYPKISFREALAACLASSPGIDLLNSVAVSTYKEHDDFRYYFYQELTYLFSDVEYQELQKKCRNTKISTKIVDMLLGIVDNQASANGADDDVAGQWWLSEPVASKTSLKQGSPLKLSSHKQVFQKCWIAALRLPQTSAQYNKVLAVLHKKLIPNMAQPQMLMDFLTDAYNAGGVISFLALNGVFALMQKYNLDYPDFFKKLYALFQDGSVMHVKYRSRVLRLVDLFLSSTHLPSSISASFIKRMARLSLSAPVGAVVSVVPFIYNQLKRHPTCMAMIHRPIAGEIADPYDILEEDPLKTNAIDSSLWEIETLQHHYHPNVATLAKIMSQPFTKPQYILEDFLDYNYKSLFEAEKERKMKVIPAVEFETFESAFGENGFIGEVAW